MKTSVSGLAFIANEEGWVPHVYLDPVGKPTIGYGHLVQPGEQFVGQLTKAQGLELLKRDLGVAENAVSSAVKVALTQSQFDALTSLAYNIGGGAFTSSTLVKLLNAGDVAGASAEFPKWSLADGKRNAILVGRRKRERAMFDAPAPETVTPVENRLPEPIVVDKRYDLRVADPVHFETSPNDETDPFGLKGPGDH